MSRDTATQTIQGEAGLTEIIALVCDVIVIAVFLWDQIRYGLNMLYLIIPLVLIGLYLFFFNIMPETYCFFENALKICHTFRSTVVIEKYSEGGEHYEEGVS